MKDIKIYGYKHNDNGKIIIDEEEAKNVRLMGDLAGNYRLVASEVAQFLNGTYTVVEIISNRLADVIELISAYDKNKAKNIKNYSNDKVLNDDNLIQKKLIVPLLEWKEKNLDLDIIDNIDNLITLLKSKDELIDKYNDLQKTKFSTENDISLN